MLSWVQVRNGFRSAAAVCLALFFSYARFAPLAAAAFAAGSACCPTGGEHACCRKAHKKTPAGPEITAAACMNGSGCHATMAKGAATLGAVRPTQFGAPALPILHAAPISQRESISRVPSQDLLQRPPPVVV